MSTTPCFGAAWPVSIYKSWTCTTMGGKSIVFLFVIVFGISLAQLRLLRGRE
jgi:hypothetical protein